ncbi:huntingtin-interacting protein K [Aspergillus foveolatus]|uniref:huntingtin-interacting protein K n=1 Tax=Aspergillus foveolatus TaxID=210207 RepID=UPI003CCD089D
MSDPIPSATTATTSELPSASAAAEDRKAAAALSSLNTTEITSETAASETKQPSSADQEALGKAMSRLEIAAEGTKSHAGSKGKGEGGSKTSEAKKKAAAVAAVKVSGEDVSLLMNELDLSKIKATELLKANEGNSRKAILAFIRPATAVA